MMQAIIMEKPGGPEFLQIAAYPKPTPGPHEILVRVRATALNRADILQRQGKYPPPPGESDILGLEMAGEVAAVGAAVEKWQPGARVCGLLAGGGYAEYIVLHKDMALPIPENLDFVAAAAIPEAFLTAFQALYWLGKLQPEETVLIHAGASGVGTAAIQLAKMAGAQVIVTASGGKHPLCYALGADRAIDYQQEDFAEQILRHTDGVDLILDFIGAPYLQKNLAVLRLDGRLICLAMMGGNMSRELFVGSILRKRLQILGSTLRNRSLDYKIQLTRDFQLAAWAAFAKGQLHPVVDAVFDWQEVAEAHRYMEANRNQGKIVLQIP